MADDHENKQDVLQEAPTVVERRTTPVSDSSRSNDISKNPSKVKLRFLSAAALIILSASAGFAGGWLGSRDGAKPTAEKQQVILESQGELISNIANEVGQSVVSVEVTSQSSSGVGFFGFQTPREQQSAGTGFIIDKNGLIVTNRHVVSAGSTKIDVTLSDGTKYEDVELVGRTSSTDSLDIAFLKIRDTKGKDLKAVKLGDSSNMKIGAAVVAIGNALGQFQNTVTSGIISGHGRNVLAGDESGSATESLQNLFQTDAAINQGNSGGPLVNLNGEVIGINTAVAGNAENIGFSIPINDAKGVINSVITKGKLERPFLGVVFVPVTADIAKQYNLSVNQGAYIPASGSIGQDAVKKGGPAEKAGLKEQDIITKVNNDQIDESHSLTSLLGKYAVGNVIKLDVVRDGKHQTIDVTLEAAAEN